MEKNDLNGLNLRTFIIDEVALDPKYVLNDDGEMQIVEFAAVPRRNDE